MTIDTRSLPYGQSVTIFGYGRSSDDPRNSYNTARLVQEWLSPVARQQLQDELDPEHRLNEASFLKLVDDKFISGTGIISRNIIAGTTADLAAEAAVDCCHRSMINPREIDAIIVGTNTGSGYPSTADLVKEKIGAPVGAFCCDVEEACVAGMAALQIGWGQVRAGFSRRALVIAAERASLLASPDDYRAANLFGDAAGAMLIGPGELESFIGCSVGSDPFEGRSSLIVRSVDGFTQNGPAVHKYVGTVVPKLAQQFVTDLDLDPARVDHLFIHQPSVKTLNFLVAALKRQWPEFNGTIHRNIEVMGNTSSACTLWMLARAAEAGQLQSGQTCLFVTFGAGMSYGFCAFQVP